MESDEKLKLVVSINVGLPTKSLNVFSNAVVIFIQLPGSISSLFRKEG